MRRPAPLLLLLALLAAVAAGLAGCGGGEVVGPTAETVIGSVPTQKALPKGNATAGKAIFTSQGCTGCHTYGPAGSNATVGPNLDKLASYARTANANSVIAFAHESIVNPSAYVEHGFADVMPKDYGSKLSDQQLADLIAFLTQKQ